MTVSDDIGKWLVSLKLGQYIEAFQANDIDLRALAYISDADLKELGVSLGHRRILLAAIAARVDEETARPQEGPAPSERAQGAAAERRQLTVIFLDLVGSTELSRRLDPEDMREVLRRFQDEVTSAVTRYEGYVAKFLGDGVLAYFGWPRAYEDQAERAVRAGLDAVAAVEALRMDKVERITPRVGIATGQVVVGDLVGEVASDAETVTGETPNLAARLQGIAKPGQVVIGSSTRALLGTTFELEELGPHDLKGYSEEVYAWAVLGEGAAESRFEAAHGGALARLVGREQELGLLQERWDLAKDSRGQIVLLSGEAGIGKSRMLQDFAKRIDNDRHFNLRYQCSPHHTNSALYPVIQRMRRAAGIVKEDSAEAKLDKLEALLRPTAEDLGAIMPLFAALLSIPDDTRYGPLELSPQQLRYRTIDAMIDQVLALSRRRPVHFVVEDAHWIDPSMADYVGQIMPRVANEAVCILVTYRPEFQPVWPEQPHLARIALNRLDRKQAAEIAHSLGGQELMDAIIDRIVARADGVPLYIEELTKSVLESYVAKDDSAVDSAIPATLQSSLVARLDRLDEAKEIAQVGAIIGREFSFDLLVAITDKSEEEIAKSLDRLVRSGLVFGRGKPPEATYTFKHSLVQDAAYNTILIKRRRQLHAEIAEVLEAQSADQPDERIELLAYHAYQGEVWDKAFAFLQRAGSKAMDRAAVREAVGHFEQALAAGACLPESRELLERSIDLRFELRNALWSIGAFEEILTHLRDAEQLATKLEDPRRIGWTSVFRSASLWQIGRSAEARAAAENALTINQVPNDLSLGIGANFYLGCAFVTSGDCRRAETYFQTVPDSLDEKQSRERCGLPFLPAVVARSWLVWALAERGEFAEAAAHGEVALEIAKEVGHPFNLAHIYYDLGYFYGVKGDIDQGVDALEKAYGLIREWNLTYLSPFIMGFLGHVLALSGRTEEGTALLEQAVADYESMGLGLFRSLVGIQLGEALFLAGRTDEAVAATERGLALARKREERGHEAYGLRLLGEIAAHPSAADGVAARGHFEAAREIAEPLGMRPLVAHCDLGLGRLARQDGREGEAEELIGTATALYRELGMDGWLARMEE